MDMPEGWENIAKKFRENKENEITRYEWQHVLVLMTRMAEALEAAKNELVPLARFLAMPPRSVSKINETLKKFKDWK